MYLYSFTPTENRAILLSQRCYLNRTPGRVQRDRFATSSENPNARFPIEIPAREIPRGKIENLAASVVDDEYIARKPSEKVATYSCPECDMSRTRVQYFKSTLKNIKVLSAELQTSRRQSCFVTVAKNTHLSREN